MLVVTLIPLRMILQFHNKNIHYRRHSCNIVASFVIMIQYDLTADDKNNKHIERRLIDLSTYKCCSP